MGEIMLKPYYVANVSGGKDSLYMLQHILDNPSKYPLDAAFHAELEIDYPFVSDVVGKMETICNMVGIPFFRVKPPVSWQSLYEKYGFPSRRRRWCNNKYKLECANLLEQMIKKQNKYCVHYIGLCADEPKRFAYDIGKIADGQTIIYPLAEDGIKESDILIWARKMEIFGGFYKICDRQGCMLCPMIQYKEMAYQMIKYPDMAKNFWDYVFSEWRKGYNVLRGDKYTPDYVYNRVITKYVPMVKEMLERG